MTERADYDLLYAIEDLRWAAEGEFGAHITPARARTLLAALKAREPDTNPLHNVTVSEPRP